MPTFRPPGMECISRLWRFAESGGQHNRPHLHAAFSGQKAVVDLNGKLIEGALPKGKMKLLLAWMEIHRDELEANWKLLCDNEPA